MGFAFDTKNTQAVAANEMAEAAAPYWHPATSQVEDGRDAFPEPVYEMEADMGPFTLLSPRC